MAGIAGTGRPRKSTAQHRVEGTYRKHRHAHITIPDPPSGTPRRPSDLRGESCAEWDRMLVRLQLCKTLSLVEDAALAQYCRLHARAVRLEKALVKEPVYVDKVTVDGAGQEHVERKVHPGFSQLRQYDLALRQYLTEFGLTPASRGRVKVPERRTPEDPFAEFDTAKGTH